MHPPLLAVHSPLLLRDQWLTSNVSDSHLVTGVVNSLLHPLMSSLSSSLHTCGVESSVNGSPYPMLAVSDALSMVLSHCGPLPNQSVSLWSAGSVSSLAAGMVLSADVLSSAPFPAFRASTMDGYAVHSTDGAGVYSVTQRITAGAAADTPLPAGELAYITTGAQLPRNADAVIMVERTETLPDGTVSGRTPANQPTLPAAAETSPLRMCAA